MYAALKASLFIQNVKLEGHHKKNHFVFYTARHRIFKYIVFNYKILLLILNKKLMHIYSSDNHLPEFWRLCQIFIETCDIYVIIMCIFACETNT